MSFQHPKDIANKFLRIVKESSAEALLYAPEFKENLEILIGCCFTFGMRHFTEREWFLERGDDPPDFNMMSPTDRETKDRPWDEARVELVTIPEKIDKLKNEEKGPAAMEYVAGKMSDSYILAPKTMLLIFVNSKDNQDIVDYLRKELNGQKKYPQIWSIYLFASKTPGDINFGLKEISPNNSVTDFSFNSEIAKGIEFKHNRIDEAIAEANKRLKQAKSN